MTTERDIWVDYAKAIGILLMVFGHAVRGLDSAGIAMPEFYMNTLDSIIYSFHMPLFFFLSGIYMVHVFDKRGVGKFFGNKIDTILYPYVLWSLVQGAIEYLFSGYTNGSVEAWDIFSIWIPRAQFWFLYALFFIFALVGIVYYIGGRKCLWWLFFVSMIMMIFSDCFLGMWVISSYANYLVYFMIGVIFSFYSRTLMNLVGGKNLFFLPMLGILFLVMQWYFHVYLGFTYLDRGGLSMIIAFISIGFVISCSVFLSKFDIPVLLYIGSMSMVIYLLHIFATSGIRIILAAAFGIDDFHIHVIAAMMFGVVLPLVMLKMAIFFNINFILKPPKRFLFENLFSKK
ncbi:MULTISPECIES: acyltransferase [unclassified Oceanobacter]|uniref:acyltransferase family protein n=1 Tax=unclassified Oceanobacter TaxID=2620260 RepID=UPI0026E3B099|nr:MULTISPECIES: acyltransferase [unclassified Oceanobacter]MDO6681333.1 acyltransferase [Oceanobacter sp. 5_MG-2023]MDP2505044.1 acyltransferase [Oceanobacter sp. 3_MG-2023]